MCNKRAGNFFNQKQRIGDQAENPFPRWGKELSLSLIEKIRARVVFNSRTGTVVMGDGVALHAAAVSHGSLTVSINETSNVSQPNAFAGGRTAVTPQSNIAVNHARPGVVSLPESSSLKTLVNALNSLGATPDDIMSILQALHEAGALDADLEVI